MTLLYDAQQFTLYSGYFLLIAGVIGNGINIFIFLKKREYRTNPCTFYFLLGSMVNIFYILLNLSIRILTTGYNVNVVGTSTAWCKIRQYLLVIPSILSITFSCLATIDQFLITSKSAYLRKCSQLQCAHRISLVALLIWCLHGIPILVFYQVSPITNTCTNTSLDFAIYTLVYLIGIICTIPVSIMIVFGWLTYRNIHRMRNLTELHIDRQLIRMTLIHVVLVTVSLFPFGVYNIYGLITSTTPKGYDRQLKEYLASSVLSMATYLYYVVGYFIFHQILSYVFI
ncbi:unnamed protein product [Adineta ricciae]|uniref:G-protein coupled receptors family 1 profile domain-containing protein n=1 Tax=Adineta ricciae TaxID=249248 RepID=A0A815HAF1_ADIRI|nr:unnamed protein product [Adineta ricciae]CAF1349590.1 unnamed protein product [Adineta ricciae]